MTSLVTRSFVDVETPPGFSTPLDLPVAVSVRNPEEAYAFLDRAAGDLAHALTGAGDSLYDGNYELIGMYGDLYMDAMDDFTAQVNRVGFGVRDMLSGVWKMATLSHKRQSMHAGLRTLDTKLGFASDPVMGLVERLMCNHNESSDDTSYIESPWVRYSLADRFMDSFARETERKGVLHETGFGKRFNGVLRWADRSTRLVMQTGAILALAGLMGWRYSAENHRREAMLAQKTEQYKQEVSQRLGSDDIAKENLLKELNAAIVDVTTFNETYGIPYLAIAGYSGCRNDFPIVQCLEEVPLPEESLPDFLRNYSAFSKTLELRVSRIQGRSKELDALQRSRIGVLEKYAEYTMQSHPSEVEFIQQLYETERVEDKYVENLLPELRIFASSASAVLAQSGYPEEALAMATMLGGTGSFEDVNDSALAMAETFDSLGVPYGG